MEVTDYWNGACVEGEKCTIAIKVNGPLEECTWYGPDKDYSSEDDDKDYEVKIEENDLLCRITIEKSDKNDHDGLWEVEAYGKSNGKNGRDRDRGGRGKRRKKRQVVVIPGGSSPGLIKRRGLPTSMITRDREDKIRSRASSRRSSKQRSDNKVDFFDIEMFVDDPSSSSSSRDRNGKYEKEDIRVLSAQYIVEGAKDEDVKLSARTTFKPTTCQVFDEEIDSRSKPIVQITDRQASKCETYESSQICLEKFEQKAEGIFACHLTIKKVKADHESYLFSALFNLFQRQMVEQDDIGWLDSLTTVIVSLGLQDDVIDLMQKVLFM